MRNLFFTLVLPLAALVTGGYAARHAFSEGMHIVIASQPGPPKYDSSSISVWDGPCSLDSNFQYKNPAQCEMQKRYPSSTPSPEPIKSISKKDSEKAGAWLMLAAFAVPLSLGAAALIGFLLFYAVPAD